MATIPNNFSHMSLVFTTEPGHELVTTFGCSNLGGTETAALDAANDVHDQWVAQLQAETSNAITLDHVNALYRNAAGTLFSANSDVGAATGTVAGDIENATAAALVYKDTAQAGRRFRGRFFFPGLILASQVNVQGEIDTLRVTALQTAFDAFFDGLVANGETPHLLHEPSLLSPTPAPTLITAFRVGGHIGIIRGRRSDPF